MTSGNSGSAPTLQAAESYIANLGGGREVVETDPGIYRRSDVTGEGYRVFTLTSLLPKTPFLVHIAKVKQ